MDIRAPWMSCIKRYLRERLTSLIEFPVSLDRQAAGAGAGVGGSRVSRQPRQGCDGGGGAMLLHGYFPLPRRLFTLWPCHNLA